MNGSVIQSIGSLSKQMKAKVLGLRLDDATSSATMYIPTPASYYTCTS